MTKRRKIRAEFRKNRVERARRADWTQHFDRDNDQQQEEHAAEERISGKGALNRKRTVRVTSAESDDTSDAGALLDVAADAQPGRVLRVHGLISLVQGADGQIYHCATRRLLKTLSTEQRHVVAAGDRVLFRSVPSTGSATRDGLIERVESRQATICRAVNGRQQVLVANVDQLCIVGSAAEPRLKPNLIDRMLVEAEKGHVEPLICINKVDLIDPADLQPLVGVFSQLGYRVLLVSAKTGQGMDRLRRRLAGRASVVAGQSGVGKSSLLNALEPDLELRVREVSAENQKGRHTTTAAALLPLSFGGYVVDTPGIRSFQLWDVVPAEVGGYYRDIRPYVSLCKYPDCTHMHEDGCAVKNAVADGRFDERRYESYCHLFLGDMQ